MRMRDVGLSLLGGCLVYTAMAACSSGAMTTGTATGTRGSQSSGTPGTTSGAPGTTSGAPGTTAGGGGMTAGGGGTTGHGGMSGMGGMMNPVPPAMADPTDGSRLKAEYRVADDGSKESVPGLWFDSMRNETCSFGTAADGATRCLPTGATQSSLFYTDTACTMTVVSVGSGCSQPAYVSIPVTPSSTACAVTDPGSHIYSIGTMMTPSALYINAGGQCFSLGQVPMATYFTLGAEVTATSFVGSMTQHQ